MIREAEPRDAESIERLYKELLPNFQSVNVLAERIVEIKNNPNSFLLVYEEKDSIVGTAHLHICLDALSGFRPFGVVERVIVSNEIQGKGYGSRLMKHIEEIASQHDCVKLMLTSQSARQQAHEFYARLGYDGEASKAFKKYL